MPRSAGSAVGIAEILEEFRIRRQDHRRAGFFQRLLIGRHRAVELEEFRIPAEGIGKDRIALRIALTTQNLTVVSADAERNLLLIKGAVPGPKGGLVLVRNAVKGPITEGAS